MVYENDMFSQPAAAGSFPLDEHLGALVLIWPEELKKDINTTFGAADAVSCRVAVLDGPNSGNEEDNVLFFPKILVSTLSKAIGTGRPVLGRIGQGTAKQGQSRPWILDPFNEADAKVAASFLNNQFSQPGEKEKWADRAPEGSANSAQTREATAKLSKESEALARSLAATPGIPPEAIASAAGTTVDVLVNLGIVEAI